MHKTDLIERSQLVLLNKNFQIMNIGNCFIATTVQNERAIWDVGNKFI